MEQYNQRDLAFVLNEALYFLREELKFRVKADEGYFSPSKDNSFQFPPPANNSSDILRLQTTISAMEYYLETLPTPKRANIPTPKTTKPVPSTDSKSITIIIKKPLVFSSQIMSLIFSFVSKDEESGQHALYNCSLVCNEWNVTSNAILWANPKLSSKKMLSKLVFCGRVSAIRAAQAQPPSSPRKYAFKWQSFAAPTDSNMFSLYVSRLDLSATLISDPQDSNLISQVVKSFPHIQTLKWGGNPMSESTLCEFFRHCPELKRLSIQGPIITSSLSDGLEYIQILQKGISRLVGLELLEFDDNTIIQEDDDHFKDSTRSNGSLNSQIIKPPTTLEEILQTLPNKGQSLTKSGLATSSPDLTGKSSSKTLKKKADQQLTKLKADSSSLVKLSPKSSRTKLSRRADLPLLLRKYLTNTFQELVISGQSTTDLVSNIARRATCMTMAMFPNCSELNDRAVIILAANCGHYLTKLSFDGCSKITDESVVEVATYCVNLTHLDLCRTAATEVGVRALGKVFQRDALLNESLVKRSSTALAPRKCLKGLYLDNTKACRDGGIQLTDFIRVAGRDLLDLSIMNCGLLSEERSMLLIDALSCKAVKLERFDARNTINPTTKIVEQAIITMGCKCSFINTLNVGTLGMEVTEFMKDLARIYPNEGCLMQSPQW